MGIGPGFGNRSASDLLFKPSDLQPKGRTCRTSKFPYEKGWMSEMDIVMNVAATGPVSVMTHVMGFSHSSPTHLKTQCLRKDEGFGHNYAILGYNAEDLANAYFIVGDTMLGSANDISDQGIKKAPKDRGYGFFKMFNNCGSSRLQGTMGLAAQVRLSTECLLKKDSRFRNGDACDQPCLKFNSAEGELDTQEVHI